MHFPWFSSTSAQRDHAKGRRACQACATVEHHHIILRTGLSELSQVSCSDGGRVTPSTQAYFLRRWESYSLHSGVFPQSPQDQPGDWRSSVGLVVLGVKTNMLGLVVINVKKNIANESTVRSAIGHFGQEVSEIKLGPNMSDKRFTHCNRFTDCVVAN